MAKFSPTSRIISHVIDMSFGIAISIEHTTVTTEHVLLGIMQSSILRKFMTASGVQVNELLTDVIEYVTSNSHLLKNQVEQELGEGYFTGELTAELTTLFKALEDYAKSEKREVVLPDVLLGLLNLRDTYTSYFMTKYGITEDIILQLRKGLTMASQDISFISAVNDMKSGRSSKGGTTASALEEYCENLNEKMKNGSPDPLIGRSKEILTIAHTFCKRKKCNVILVGDPGVGKSMIMEGLAQRINDGKVPEPLKNKVIYSLDVGQLVAGAKFRGEYEDKIKGILAELTERTDAILFIDEAQNIDAGDGKGQMGVGLSSMIKPYLSRGAIKVAAATTWEGFRQTFEKDSALMRRFRVIGVGEPSPVETIEILKGLRPSMEAFHSVDIKDSAVEAAVELTVKYQKDKHLPDKAIDILDSACARKKVVDGETNVIDRSSINREVIEVTGIPIKSEETSETEAKRVLELNTRLKNLIFHQDKAIDTVSQSLIISHAGLKDPKKPIGSFLFVGPSGSGKTFLSEELARDLDMDFIRFNMSEYMEKHSIAKLIGAPPGYIGYSDGGSGEGLLITELKRKPNSVVLFDEVEKAHPDIYNIFLQLFDEGQVTGGNGKTADSKNCIFVMTSNLGTKAAQRTPTGFGGEKTGKGEVDKAVEEFFLTELRGRLTAVVKFDELDELSFRRIIVERINDIAKMLTNRNLRVVASETLISHILKLNKDSAFGARNIAGIVKDLINYQLSLKLLSGQIVDDSSVTLDWADNALVIDQKLIKVPVEAPIEK
jgi:ATP-dependent Clp protease ATP-binding subunit ClpA